MIPSLVHDALYQLIKLGKLNIKYRKAADKVLKHLCLECGMPKWRAEYVYWFVRIGGGKAIGKILNAESEDKIIDIPLPKGFYVAA